MLSSSVPPSSGAVNDTVAILKLIQDPTAAAETLNAIAVATRQHDEALHALMSHKEDLSAREKKLEERGEALRHAEETVRQREANNDAHEDELMKGTRDLAEARLAHKRALDEHLARVAAHEANVRATDDRQLLTDKALVEREAGISARAAEVTAREKSQAEREATLRRLLMETPLPEPTPDPTPEPEPVETPEP